MEDAPALVKYADNRKIWLNLRDGFPHPYRLQDAQDFIRHSNASVPKTVYAIATETEAIGSIGLMLGRDVHRFTAEMGYWLAEPFWGKGIMTRAVKAMAAYAIGDLLLHRISAVPYAANSASARVLEKAGFKREGTLRCSAFKDGKIVDQVLYSLVKPKVHRHYLVSRYAADVE